MGGVTETSVSIPVGAATLSGDLHVPSEAAGVVVFAHGSGSGRFSPRNRAVAQTLQDMGLGTLLMDLLTADEEAVDLKTGELRFNVELLGERVVAAVDWTAERDPDLPAGLFGASTGAAAALVAAAERPDTVRAVVSRGGRPDLAAEALPRVRAPTLLVVGAADHMVITLNEGAMEQMSADVRLEIVPGASHLFEEPGALERVAELASDWFRQHLPR